MEKTREEWKAMTKEEQIEATKDEIEEMGEERLNRQSAQHQSTLAAACDVARTIVVVEREVRHPFFCSCCILQTRIASFHVYAIVREQRFCS